jgi:hypothetical protein
LFLRESGAQGRAAQDETMYQPKTTAVAVLRLILSVVAKSIAVITRVQ